MMKSWYSIKNKSADTGSISIHDEIGLWGVSAADFIKELRNQRQFSQIELSIHSPGGNLLDGLAMYNALKDHPAKITAKVEGIAASAASFVLMAADVISMPEDAFLMVHNAQGGAFGESRDLRDMADIMDRLQNSIVNIYQQRTGLDPAEIADMMSAETWMSAKEAQKLGFVDHVIDRVGVAAKAGDFSKHFKAMPFNFAAELDGIATERDLEAALRDAGASKSHATALVAKAKTLFRRESEPDQSQIELAALSARLTKMKISLTY
jgi:ATP-dependent Clp protease protease subunit